MTSGAFDLAALAQAFAFQGTFAEGEPYGSGHINDTFRLQFRQADGACRRYILQRINHQVFRDPDGLMANVVGVTRHLRAKVEAAGGDPSREALNLVWTREGAPAHRDDRGNTWRAYDCIEGARTYDQVTELRHITLAGRAIGHFQALMADYPAHQLVETIPDFHHTPRRFQALWASVAADAAGRVAEVAPELAFARAREADGSVIADAMAAGAIPLRVTHNDTKFNNVMIDDATGEAICVIDLDTVMPGSALYDFGDAIRSSCNTAAEDESDLERVGCSLEVFEAYAHGYLSAARTFLVPAELEHLAFSAKLLTLECGIRFLKDHLDGDVYFKVHRPGHNLDRARNQFKLVADLEARMDTLKALVAKHA